MDISLTISIKKKSTTGGILISNITQYGVGTIQNIQIHIDRSKFLIILAVCGI